MAKSNYENFVTLLKNAFTKLTRTAPGYHYPVKLACLSLSPEPMVGERRARRRMKALSDKIILSTKNVRKKVSCEIKVRSNIKCTHVWIIRRYQQQ